MYITIPQFCERNPAFSKSLMYKLVSKAQHNGLDAILVRVPLTTGNAKKIAFKEDDMLEWLKSRKAKNSLLI